jgi:hypothetical protein
VLAVLMIFLHSGDQSLRVQVCIGDSLFFIFSGSTRFDGGPLVPPVELGAVARVPGLAKSRRAQVPVRADLAGHGVQAVPEVERPTADPRTSSRYRCYGLRLPTPVASLLRASLLITASLDGRRSGDRAGTSGLARGR